MFYLTEYEDIVSLTREIPLKTTNLRLPIILGKDSRGNIFTDDLFILGSTLISGVAGSGKTNLIHSLICSLLLRFQPSELKFFMADVKRSELTVYSGIPNLYRPVLIEAVDAISSLQSLVKETNRRLTNKNTQPYLIAVIDTFSDLISANPSVFQERIGYIASHSFDTGIFVIMSDSRTAPDVFTESIIKAFPTKIAFLETPGKMQLSPSDNSTPIKLQSIEVLEGEINYILDLLKGKRNTLVR